MALPANDAAGRLRELLSALEGAATEASPTEVPLLLGELERTRATLWSRLLAPGVSEGRPVDDEEGQLLTVPEVAKSLGVGKSRVYDMVRQGEMPAVRFGKYVRIRASELRHWVDRHEQPAVADDLYGMYSRSQDRRPHARRRAKANSQETRADAGSSGRTPRRQP